jgi:hypothetical protein
MLDRKRVAIVCAAGLCGLCTARVPALAAGNVTLVQSFKGNAPMQLLAARDGDFFGLSGRVLYRLAPPQGSQTAWSYDAVYTFPDGYLITDFHLDARGVFYGVGLAPGVAASYATVFTLRAPAPGGAGWSLYTIALTGGGPTDPQQPQACVEDAAGNIYTEQFGVVNPINDNTPVLTLLKFTPPASGQTAWTQASLYQSTWSLTESPGAMVAARGGMLYQPFGAQVVAFLPPSGSGTTWNYSVVASFAASKIGPNSVSNLAQDSSRELYGTSFDDGTYSAGTVFELIPSGSGAAGKVEVLYNFDGLAPGGFPEGGVVLGSGGVLYGTTGFGGIFHNGTVYSLTPPGSGSVAWSYALLYGFGPRHDGIEPFTAPVPSATGKTLVGLTRGGGASNAGTAFELTP